MRLRWLWFGEAEGSQQHDVPNYVGLRDGLQRGMGASALGKGHLHLSRHRFYSTNLSQTRSTSRHRVKQTCQEHARRKQHGHQVKLCPPARLGCPCRSWPFSIARCAWHLANNDPLVITIAPVHTDSRSTPFFSRPPAFPDCWCIVTYRACDYGGVNQSRRHLSPLFDQSNHTTRAV